MNLRKDFPHKFNNRKVDYFDKQNEERLYCNAGEGCN